MLVPHQRSGCICRVSEATPRPHGKLHQRRGPGVLTSTSVRLLRNAAHATNQKAPPHLWSTPSQLTSGHLWFARLPRHRGLNSTPIPGPRSAVHPRPAESQPPSSRLHLSGSPHGGHEALLLTITKRFKPRHWVLVRSRHGRLVLSRRDAELRAAPQIACILFTTRGTPLQVGYGPDILPRSLVLMPRAQLPLPAT